MGDEMKMGGFLLNSPLKLPLKFDQGALSLTLNDLCPEWNNSAQSQIEIPLERLWNDTSGNFHLSFSFESSSTYEQSNMAVASIGALSAKLNITQGDQQHEIPFCIRPHEVRNYHGSLLRLKKIFQNLKRSFDLDKPNNSLMFFGDSYCKLGI